MPTTYHLGWGLGLLRPIRSRRRYRGRQDSPSGLAAPLLDGQGMGLLGKKHEVKGPTVHAAGWMMTLPGMKIKNGLLANPAAKANI